MVVTISLRTEDRARYDGDVDDFETVVPVRLAAKLRDGTVVTRAARCTAHDYELNCQDEDDVFRLIRAGEKALTVRDINARKLMESTENFLAKFLRADLGDDDRVFRLDEQADSACALHE
jgi:hypothetical protein